MALALPIIVTSGRARSGSARPWSGWSASACWCCASPGRCDTLGLVGAFGSVVVSALGFVLVKHWPAPVDMLTLVSWQLVVGGLVLLPVGLLVEGAPPAIDLPARRRVHLARAWSAPASRTLLVPRPHPDAGRRRLADRPGQPGRRHRPRRGRSPASSSAGRRRSAWCWSSAACSPASLGCEDGGVDRVPGRCGGSPDPEPALACATSRA